jgi:hypothetical protein
VSTAFTQGVYVDASEVAFTYSVAVTLLPRDNVAAEIGAPLTTKPRMRELLGILAISVAADIVESTVTVFT